MSENGYGFKRSGLKMGLENDIIFLVRKKKKRCEIFGHVHK